MTRFITQTVVGLIVTLAASAASAQPGPDSVPVTLKGDDFEFSDVYEFLETGALNTGGIESTATVTRFVPEQRVRQVTKTVYRIINGRLVPMTIVADEAYTVYVPVQENFDFVLPPLKGVWFGAGLDGISVWLINSAGPSGLVFGFGTRHGESVDGIVSYLTIGSGPPSGVYQVSTDVVATGE